MLILDVFTWKTSSTSDLSRLIESMSEVVWLGDRLDELEDLGPVLAPAAGLALHLLEEELLALHAREVARLVVAEAHEVERLLAVHELVAGLEVDGLPARPWRVVVAVVDGDVDAAEDVDDVPEAGEVDLDVVVDRQAGERGERLHRAGRPAVGVGGVHLVVADSVDVDAQVARDARASRCSWWRGRGARGSACPSGRGRRAPLLSEPMSRTFMALPGSSGRSCWRVLVTIAFCAAVWPPTALTVPLAHPRARPGAASAIDDDGDADELDGEVAAEGDVGGDGREDGDGQHRHGDHRPAGDLAGEARQVEGRLRVADHVAAVEPEEDAGDDDAGGDEPEDQPGARAARGVPAADATNARAAERRGRRSRPRPARARPLPTCTRDTWPSRSVDAGACSGARHSFIIARAERRLHPRRRFGRPPLPSPRWRRAARACPPGPRSRGRRGGRSAPR